MAEAKRDKKKKMHRYIQMKCRTLTETPTGWTQSFLLTERRLPITRAEMGDRESGKGTQQPF